MKRSIYIVAFILIIFITACSSSKPTANDTFDTFVQNWNKEDFAEMYKMLSTDSKATYKSEEFIDRYTKIYNDLGISDLKVTYNEIEDEQLKKTNKDGKAILSFQVDMNSIAGPISYDYEANLVKEENEDDSEDWFVNWDSGFIFPELKDGGNITVKTTPPSRGDILDRNKMPLALNDEVREIGVVPGELGDNEANKEHLANSLNMSIKDIDEKINQGWVEPNLFVPLKTVLPSNKDLLQQVGAIDGVTSNKKEGRVYPLNKAAAHLVGYIGTVTAEDIKASEPGDYSPTDKIGKRGLEQLFEKQLKGESGASIYVKKEDEDDLIIAEKEVKNGKNVQVTIDVNVQEKIYNSYNGDAGTASAIDPKTGEALALVSSPSFDPNDILYGTSKDIWDNLSSDPETPLINRFSSTFAPGSVIKPLTAAIGLGNDSIDPDKGIEINGLTWSKDESWGNYKVRRVSTSSGPVDLADALIRSDNIYFAKQAVDMGKEKYVKGLKDFGIGEDLPFEYPIKSSTISSDGTIDNEVLLANTSYGQGEIQLSSLHMALAYTPFLNKGNLLKPTLLMDEEDKQIWHKELITADQAELMQDNLRKVVTEGTAKKADEASFPISGKTGTAELKLSTDSKNGVENGWFIGYPTDEEDILIAMMVEKTQDRGGSSYTVEKVTEALTNIRKSND